MNKIKTSYGICIQPCVIVNRNSNKLENLRQGDLVRILESDCIRSDKIVIKLYNFDQKNFKTDLFECPKRDTDLIEEDLWSYMIGAKENHVRIQIYNERNLVLGLKCGHEIIIKSFEDDLNANIKGLVKLIGPANDAGNGSFVGMEIMEPPLNRETFEVLYKKHFNMSTSMFVFRIEQLLDALRHTRQQNLRKMSNENIAPQFARYPDSNVVKMDMVNYERTNAMDKFSTPDARQLSRNSNTYESSNLQITPKHLNAVGSYYNQIATNSGTSGLSNTNYFASALSNSNYTSQISNNSAESSHNWRITSQPTNDLDLQRAIYASSLNQNPACNMLSENTKLVDIRSNENVTSTKVIDNNSAPFNIRRDRYDAQRKTKNRPRKWNAKYQGPCQKCKKTFVTVRLKCNHFICVKCFPIQRLTKNENQIQCPFISFSNIRCQYILNPAEIKEMHRNLNDIVQQPARETQSSSSEDTEPDEEEEIFECKSSRCPAKWVISKSDSGNLYRCPLCNESNCVACKDIHDNMTCKEYKQSVKEKPNALQQIYETLSNLVISLKPEGAGAGSQKIPDNTSTPEGNEILMKCKSKNCAGQWFKLKNDNNTIFKCPVCQAYNCSTCQAIHFNQTCYEYQKNRQRYLPNFLKTNNPNIRPPPVPNPLPANRGNAIAVGDPANNPLIKRKWTCTFCTYENFSFGYICQICQQNNLGT